MWPVGRRGEHLSSGPLLSGGEGVRGWALLPLGGAAGRWPHAARPPARLAGCRPLPAKHMVSLFSLFTGNRDSRGINRFSWFLSERLDARRKVQK